VNRIFKSIGFVLVRFVFRLVFSLYRQCLSQHEDSAIWVNIDSESESDLETDDDSESMDINERLHENFSRINHFTTRYHLSATNRSAVVRKN